VTGTRKRITGLHFLGPDAGHLLLSGSRHRRGIGEPHRRETWSNPPRVWTFDRLPGNWCRYFSAVVEDITRPDS